MKRGESKKAEEDEYNLTQGQMSILDDLRILGGPITADRYAYLNFSPQVRSDGWKSKRKRGSGGRGEISKSHAQIFGR
jgi:hypothetical protein